MNEHNERWLPIAGFDGAYEVSDQGRVRSVSRVIIRSNGTRHTHRGTVLKPGVQRSGHMLVSLKIDAVGHTRDVHKLVLEAFAGLRPEDMECCHNNGDPADNRLVNLRWDSKSENGLDRVRHGAHYNVNKTHCPQGHSYSDENTYVYRGRRNCRTCARTRGIKRRETATTP